jgi:hypothetical protein
MYSRAIRKLVNSRLTLNYWRSLFGEARGGGLLDGLMGRRPPTISPQSVPSPRQIQRTKDNLDKGTRYTKKKNRSKMVEAPG